MFSHLSYEKYIHMSLKNLKLTIKDGKMSLSNISIYFFEMDQNFRFVYSVFYMPLQS